MADLQTASEETKRNEKDVAAKEIENKPKVY